MALGSWSNPYGALGGGKASTGDLTMFGGPPASTGGGFFSRFGKLGNLGGEGGDMWGAIGSSLISGIFASRAASQQANAQMRMTEAQDRRFNNMVLENRGIGKLKIANALWQDWANDRMQNNNLERQKLSLIHISEPTRPY